MEAGERVQRLSEVSQRYVEGVDGRQHECKRAVDGTDASGHERVRKEAQVVMKGR